MSDKPLVIYHDSCADGFCSAWLFRFAFPDADFHPARYEDPPPEVVGRDVFVVDFSYPLDVTERLATEARSLVILDHHKSAGPVLLGAKIRPDVDQIVFDVTKSGCRLAWEYLWRNHLRVMEWVFPGDTLDRPNWLVQFVEDRDLWTWKLTKSREVNAFIRSFPFDFGVWDDELHCFLMPVTAGRSGEAILRAEQRTIDAHVAQAWKTTIAGHVVPVVNCTTLISEVTGKLAEGQPFAASYRDRDGWRVWSLRSASDGLDVSEIARQFGGGGHKNAAGYQEKL